MRNDVWSKGFFFFFFLFFPLHTKHSKKTKKDISLIDNTFVNIIVHFLVYPSIFWLPT